MVLRRDPSVGGHCGAGDLEISVFATFADHIGSGSGSRQYVLELPRSRLLARIAAAAHKAGTAPVRNICRGRQSIDSITPPRSGPTIEPRRPTPNAQPTPVDRIDVG